jgi:hypothetical protein
MRDAMDATDTMTRAMGHSDAAPPFEASSRSDTAAPPTTPGRAQPRDAATPGAGPSANSASTIHATPERSTSAATGDHPGDPPHEPSGDEPTTRALRWHDVQRQASTQLKAFLKPAEETITDGTLTLRYDASYRFHFSQIVKRQDELAALVADVAGPGWDLVLEGPEGTIRKKA